MREKPAEEEPMLQAVSTPTPEWVRPIITKRDIATDASNYSTYMRFTLMIDKTEGQLPRTSSGRRFV